jgi:hypothetical protein
VMKAFYHEVPEDQVLEGETSKKIVLLLYRVANLNKPGWVTLWIDKKKPHIFYFQPILDFLHWGEEMKKTFDYEPNHENKTFIIKDIFREKSQILFIYKDFYK